MKRKYINLSILFMLFCGQLIEVNGQNTALAKEPKQLVDSVSNNLVQTGMKTEKSWRNTSAVYSISGKELERMNTANLLNALNGRIPGLTVITGSGEPGYDNPSFAIRGVSSWNTKSNNMLVYLDGFEVSRETIGTLSASEVESVTVLKDAASLAVYGFSGDGVIVVTTKKGKISGKTVISMNARYGVQSAIQLPSSLNAYDYTRFYNQARQNDGLPVKYANPELYKSADDPIHPNVDWYKEVLKTASPVQNYNISFRGGGDKAKYFLILDHANFSGLYKNADEIDKDFGTNAIYKKYNLRGNIQVQLSNNFSVRSEISGKIEDRITPSGFTASNMFTNLLKIPAAAFPVKNPNGSWATNAVNDFNPVELLKQGGIYSGHTRNLQANIVFTEKLDIVTKGLSLNGGLSFSNNYMGYYNKSFVAPTFELIKDASDNPILDASGKYTYLKHNTVSSAISDGEVSHWNRSTFQIGLDYARSFDKHSFTGMLLAKRQDYTYNGITYDYRTQGISADVTYDYSQKYILNLSMGYMGSDNLGSADRYGFFPAVGAGWILSKEDFLKDISAINFLKVRASYGLTGSLDEDYRFKDKQWASSSSNAWLVTESNTAQTGWAEGQLGNPNFSWEKKKALNFGFESTLFNDLSVSFDVFNEKRTGILQTPTAEVPMYAGFKIPVINNGEVTNRGFEAMIRYNGHASDFQYHIGVSAAFARNKIDYISEVAQPFPYLYATGYRIDQARGLVCDGFYQTADFDSNGVLKSGIVKSMYANVKPGDLKYKDQTNDGIINDYDKVPMNYSNIPELTMGLNLGFNYKGFDFDAFFQGVTNRTISMPSSYTQPFVNNNNITPFSLNAWTPETALTATSPRLTTQANLNNTQSSDFWMLDGSFIKLRSIELGYTVPKIGFVKRFDTLRLYLNGTNLFTWDKIDALEAENLSMGYPLMKAVSFGLNVVF